MSLSDFDKESAIARYKGAYKRFGYSPKSLGWDKGKQDLRFSVLTSHFACRSKSILDIGCGFGDLTRYLTRHCSGEYTYTGIDVVPEFIDEAVRSHAAANIRFLREDFLSPSFTEEFDIILASGIFNLKPTKTNQYAYIYSVMQKAFLACREGFCFDFLSDKVDFTHNHTFHSNPEKILSMAYTFSRNVILKNNYFPFEFSLCVMKDDSFSPEDTIFTVWKSISQAG